MAHLIFGVFQSQSAIQHVRPGHNQAIMTGTSTLSGEGQQCNLWSFTREGLVATALYFSDISDYSLSASEPSTKRYEAAFLLCLAASILCFVVSTLSSNYSQVDKIWSIIPVLYAWIAVYRDSDDDDMDLRSLMMAVLATIWGVRLTWNFNRRGGYTWPPWKGDEDYRWAYIQKGEYLPILSKPLPWMLFNLFFISIYQNVLLMLIAMPSFVVADIATRSECQSILVPLTLADYLLAMIYITLIILETLADNQQWKFQQEKIRRRKNGNIDISKSATDDYAAGFCRSGLFAILRKPNYSCEQSIWICNYFFTISAAGGTAEYLLNWSFVGCFLLVLLFQGSGAFTEKLSSTKYPEYSQYKKDVPLYVPSLKKVWELLAGGGTCSAGGRDDQKVE